MRNFIHEYYIDEKICKKLIQYHKKNKEYRAKGVTATGYNKDVKDSTDVYVYNMSNDPNIRAYFKALSTCVDNYCKIYGINQVHTSHMGNNIQHYAPGGGFKKWHCERGNLFFSGRALVYMTYLNNVTDKGETEFKYYNLKVKAKAGLTLIWPPDFTHTHRGIPSPTQHKWIMTGWFDFVV
tara:strand:- start:1646 stop:2188 length:543 start_codon:yes stop_codon:yes gene_type:complete